MPVPSGHDWIFMLLMKRQTVLLIKESSSRWIFEAFKKHFEDYFCLFLSFKCPWTCVHFRKGYFSELRKYITCSAASKQNVYVHTLGLFPSPTYQKRMGLLSIPAKHTVGLKKNRCFKQNRNVYFLHCLLM